MFNKRGISAVVATVLIILITVAAVTIIWTAIVPMIKQQLNSGTGCLNADVTIDNSYSCVDFEKGIVAIRVKKGSADVELSGLEFVFSSEGSSETIPKEIKLEKNSAKVFGFDLSKDLSELDFEGSELEVKVAPVLMVEGDKKICTALSSIKLKSCSLTDDVLDGVEDEGGEDFLFEEDLISYFSFEESLEDGFDDNDCVLGLGSEVSYGEGIQGKAYISSSGNYIQCDSDAFNFQDNFSISLWFNPEQGMTEGKYYNILSFGGIYNSGYGIEIYGNPQVHAPSIEFWTKSSGSYSDLHVAYSTYDGSSMPGNWQHVVAVFNGDENIIYLNGQEEAEHSRISSSGIMNNNYAIRFGESFFISDFSTNFLGEIDEVSIYNHALDEEEVSQLYSAFDP